MPSYLKLIIALFLSYCSWYYVLRPGYYLYSGQDKHAEKMLDDMSRYREAETRVDSVLVLENSVSRADWREGPHYRLRHRVYFFYTDQHGVERKGDLEFTQNSMGKQAPLRMKVGDWDSLQVYYDTVNPQRYVSEESYQRFSDPEFHEHVGGFKKSWFFAGIVLFLLSFQWFLRVLVRMIKPDSKSKTQF